MGSGKTMEQIIMYIMAAGVILGGLDRIFGNKKGYGKRMEDGFMYMGPTALSMVGMMCIIPVFSNMAGQLLMPLYHLTGIDPAMFGGLLAIDMGGYQLARDIAVDARMGAYAGIIVAATFGCTFIFTIPVGMRVLEREDYPFFFKGITAGLVALPAGLAAGGLACGLSVFQILHQNALIFLLAIFLMAGLRWQPERLIRGLGRFASAMQILITVGLILGAVQYMTGQTLVPGLYPIEEGLEVVASIGIVMLGSLPAAEFLQRVLKKPFGRIGGKIGLNEVSIAGLFVGTVSVLPQLIMLKDMDRLGKIVNTAYIVSAASMFAAHIGFTMNVQPDLLGALIGAKMTGGLVAVLLAVFLFKNKMPEKNIQAS